MECKDKNIEKNNINKENKIKDFFKKNKKLIIISGIIIVILVAILLLMIFLKNDDKVKSNEKELINTLTELGKDFYEVKYYPGLSNPKKNKLMTDEEKKKAVAKFKDTGITINFENLARIQENKEELTENFKNNITNKPCDKENTVITIYPVEPYGLKDYKINVTLKCGFDEE